MRKIEDKPDILSIGLTVGLHLLVILFLWLFCFEIPEVREESGLPVMIGNMGNLDTDYDLTEVQTYSPPVHQTPVSTTQAEPLVTQDMEETVALDDGQKKVEKIRNEVVEPTPEELRAQAEARAAAEANNLMQNLFGESSQTASATADATAQAGVAGSPQGNSLEGKPTGVGGFGTFDLNGRDVDANGLQRPAYTVQEEGRVVVTITVNPEGKVIATSINKRTNTMNANLRKAAEDAARRTRFNSVAGPDNQTGTITYYFRLK